MNSKANNTFDFNDLMRANERTMTALFDQSCAIAHAGDRGENREQYLREFLERHLPTRYGFVKGQIVTKSGRISHAVDIIVYDRLTCPVFYSGKTAIIPIEGVYGIIEVKSSLSKDELADSVRKIKMFKDMCSIDIGLVNTGQAFKIRTASRPFGAVFAYRVADNSLNSLKNNLEFFNKMEPINLRTNLVCVMGAGNIFLEGIEWDRGEKFHLIETDGMINFFEKINFDKKSGVDIDMKYFVRLVAEESNDSFGRFLSYLQFILSNMELNIPDIGRYVGAGTPILVVKQS